MAACPVCGKENPEGFQFCGFCTAPLAGQRAAERELRKTVTVVFCDVVGSTSLGEAVDPEALRALLTRYFERMSEIVDRHGGTVEKFIGDAVVAVFGVPVVHEDDALRACRAAIEMRDSLPELDVDCRIGVNTGEVITAAGQSLATGDPMNVAARLEQRAEPGEILLGDSTYALVAHAVEATELEPMELRGKSVSTRAFRLDAVRADATAIPRRADTPFAGRAPEVERVRAAFSDVVASRSVRLLTVLGEAGIGKSRLVQEFLSDVEAEAVVLVGRCPPYGEGVTFSPIEEIFRTAGHDDHALDVSSYEVFSATRRLLAEAALERPVVVAFDDVHWAEETMLDLIEHLAARLGDATVLVVCIGRPELADLRPQWVQTPWSTVVVEPLSSSDSGSLIDSLGAPAELRDTIRRLAEGNPLFIEQVSAFAVEARGATLTASIRAVLQARLDRIAAEERDVLERAAVVGRSFSFDDVIALTPPAERNRAQGRLFDLVRRGLVRPDSAGEEGFRFSHALIRDAVYEAMPKTLRAELHEAVADQLIRSDRSETVAGFHLERGFQLRSDLGTPDAELGARAGLLLGRAAQEALAHGDVPGAIALFERARAVLPATDPGLPLLLTSLGAARINAGDTAGATSTLDAAVGAAVALGDRAAELHARIERQFARMFAEAATPVEESTALATAAIPELEAFGDELALARAWWLKSSGDLASGRWRARGEAIERALEHARRADAGMAMVGTLAGLLAQALLHGPTPAPAALERVDRLMAELQLDAAHTGPVLASRAGLLAMEGRIDDARSELGRAAALNEEFGLRFRRAAQGFVAAQIELAAGDLEAAERELRTSSAALAAYGAATSATTHRALLADVLWHRGNFAQSEEEGRRVAAEAAATDVLAQVLWRTAVARTLARRGAAGEARGLADEALALCAGVEFPFLQVAALTAAADVRGETGDEAVRVQLLADARAVADAKGNVVDRARLDPPT